MLLGGIKPRLDVRAPFCRFVGIGKIFVGLEIVLLDPAQYRLGVRPEEAIFVDDMPANVEAARALGFHGIQFRSTAQTIADVEKVLDGQVTG